MAIFQPFAFRAEEEGGGGGLPPVGSYITTGLTYYFDFGEPTSYSGTGTSITNLAPAGSKRGDAVIYAGTTDLGSQTTSGTTFNATKGTLKLGGSGGTWNQYTTNQNWFGDITNARIGTWASGVTAEFGFYYYPHTWTSIPIYGAVVSQRNAGPGQLMAEREISIYGVANYNFTPLTWVTGQAYIVTVVMNGTSGLLYINGSLQQTITISATRRGANGSPFVWGCLYTKEGGNDRLANPSWSEYQYVRFYEDTAFNATQVLQNYNANKARLGL